MGAASSPEWGPAPTEAGRRGRQAGLSTDDQATEDVREMAATAMTPHADPDVEPTGISSSGRPAVPAHSGRLLELDPAFARRLSPELRARLAPALRVEVVNLRPGTCRASDLPRAPQTLGLLVLDGLLLRDLTVQERSCAELLGAGDLLRPWPDPDGPAGALGAADLDWHVVSGPASVAIIDRRASLLIGRFPDLMAELLDRTLSRARLLQLQLALSQVSGIGQRLEILLWHLADRWGRVTRGGVVVPLELTHEMLGRLIGARRPSVTTALCRLREQRVVERHPEGWLLRGDPLTNPHLSA
jgi:hypothetical protein